MKKREIRLSNSRERVAEGFQNLTLQHTNEYMTYRGIYDDTTYNPLYDVTNTTFDDVIYSDANHSNLNYNGTLIAVGGVDPRVYIFAATFLIVFCTISLAVNIVVLSSVFFMRSRVYPTLYISLSLAGADTFSLLFYALGLFFFTLLPRLDIRLNAPCVHLLLEALRMGAILTTMFHLAALAVNHYLGIRLPLHYNVYMTRRNIQYGIALLWIVPSFLLILYMFLLEGDSFNTCPYE
ncbi:hypothetical protein J6590_056058 [Homalodisca vitripennis]|nr:hypothetical protein J6590_056058 [Homalodisca vitripennis]